MPGVGRPVVNPPVPKPSPAPAPRANLRTGNNPRGVAILPPRPAAPQRSFAARVGGAITRTAPAPASAARHVSTAARQASPAGGRLAATLGGRTKGGRQSSMVALERSVFNRMAQAGVLAPGARLPKLVVDSVDPSWMVSKGSLAEYVTPGAGPGGRVVHIPPSVARNRSARPWVQQALVHEIAHTMQNKDALSSEAMREGGAQAYTERVVGRVLPGQQHFDPGGYADFVRQLQTREPPDWATRGQFQPGRTAPPINMPGTQAFGGAMRGVGMVAGGATDFAGLRLDPAIQAALKRRRY